MDTATQSLTGISTNVKPAAIWARVSTHNQAETSLPSQVSRCKEKLKQSGFSVIHILQTDWSSLDLFSCPEFQQLRALIKGKEIKALGILERDRLEAKGLQRLIFLSELKESGIELLVCQGPPLIDGPEGQIVELALAIGKERQVLRARQGSRDGLHDRAVKYHKPVTFHRVYGYTWDKANLKLIPDDNYVNAKLIFQLLLEGKGYTKVIRELAQRGIPSPSGMAEWTKTAISSIVHNPIYAGRYFALKKVAVEPKKRKTNSYGNSSVKQLPLEQAHYMPEIEVIDPPITWQQRELLLNQVEVHQKLARRNAKRDYLLRGLIHCQEHRGKNGDSRRFHGQPHGKSYRYTCPVGGCKRAFLSGPSTDEQAKLFTRILLSMKGKELRDFLGNKSEYTEKSLLGEMNSLDLKMNRLISKQAKLEDGFLSGQIPEDVHTRLVEQYRTEREWIAKTKSLMLDRFNEVKNLEGAVRSVGELHKKLWGRINNLSDTEWRQLLETLDFRLLVNLDNAAKEMPVGFYANVDKAHLRDIVFIFGFNIPGRG